MIYGTLAADPSHPVEGGTSNDYSYVDDPINEFDLSGEGKCPPFLHRTRKDGSHYCKGNAAASGARAVGRSAVSAGKTVGRAAVAVGKDFGTCITGQPCVIGDALDYVAVNGALITMAGLGVFAGVASCATVIGCVAGGTLGFGGAGAAGYGLYAYNRSFWKEHG